MSTSTTKPPLADRPLVQVAEGTPALEGAALAALKAELGPSWIVLDGKLRREWELPDFSSALALAVRLGMVAEKLDHHPDLHVSWGKVVVEVWTHTVDGLSEADFVFAANAEKVGL
jgi:4a-hydroxytetrahydrobiopterin dehydratase